MPTFIAKNKLFSVILTAIFITAAVFFLGSGEAEPATRDGVSEKAAKAVELIDLSSLEGTRSIQASGVVESSSQANLSAERSGVVKKVNVSLGDRVAAGDVLVELDTAEDAANLARARSVLEAAISRSRSSEVEVDNATLSLGNAVENARTTIDDTLGADISQFFSDKDDLTGFGVTLSQGNSTFYIKAYDVDEARAIRTSIREAKEAIGTLDEASGAPVERQAELTEEALNAVRDVLDAIGDVINGYAASDTNEQAVYNPYKNDISAARSEIGATITSLRSKLENYRNRQITDTKEQIEQSEAEVAAARARLSKGFIRAPFSGTVTSITPETGESVSPGESLVSLVDKERLTVRAGVSAKTAKRISAGSEATIENIKGRVKAVSSAVNENTGRVEVEITVLEPGAPLIVGEVVDVSIEADDAAGETFLPLSAVRTTGEGSYVFTPRDGLAARVEVKTGSVLAGAVSVTEGLEGVGSIIRDASGVQAGDAVRIISN